MILYKDTANPIISITNPIEDQEYGVQAPTYDFDIDELFLDAMWYVIISEGSTTHIISSTSGAINETLWDSLDDGYITIRFYANDTLGHEGYAEVIIIKLVHNGQYQLVQKNKPNGTMYVEEGTLIETLHRIIAVASHNDVVTDDSYPKSMKEIIL